MVESNGSKYVSIKWVVSILAALVFAASGMIVADTRAGITKALYATECLQRDKVDKDQHYRELAEIKSLLLRIEDKIDRKVGK